MAHPIFYDILLIFLLAIPVVLLGHLFRLPSIIGFLATGALIGPYGIGLIHDSHQINILAEVGVTLLLFTVGLEFSLVTLKKLKYQSLFGALLQIGGTFLVGALIGQLLNWSLYQSVYFGCLLTLSSTALVIGIMLHHKMLDSVSGQLSTSYLIMQDLALIPMIIILPIFALTRAVAVEWTPLLSEAGQALFVILLIAILGRILAQKILHVIFRSRSRELFIVTIVVIALGMAWLTHMLGLSPALGAFLGGLMIGGTEYKYQAHTEISSFRYCFNSIFFVSIGMLLNFEFVIDHFGLVLLFAIMIPVIKLVITTLSTWVVGIPLRLSIVVGISLAQIGEFSFLLAYTGQKVGAISPVFYELIVATAVISMIITPVLVNQAPHVADWLIHLPGFRHFARSEQEELAAEESETLSEHVIICGFGPLGETFGKILKEHRIPYIVLELNPQTIEKIRLSQDPVFFGDGASEEILYKCGIERARMLAITVPDYLNSAAIIQQARKLNPNIRIITRAKYRNEVDKLYDAGADIVISEELEGGVEMGRYALNEVGIDPDSVTTYINRVREFGSADFF